MKTNPALSEQPRNRPAAVIPVQRDASILAWLEGTNRLLERDASTSVFGTEEEDEEIDELMDGEDDGFDDDDDLDLDD